MNSDFLDILSLLNRFGVDYLVVGGHAVMLHTEPRYTKDLDIAILANEKNIDQFRQALEEFGFPMSERAVEELSQPNRMISIGRPPHRIDFLNQIDGVDLTSAIANRVIHVIEGAEVAFISKADLILAKRASGRPQDLIDLNNLEKS